MKFLNSIADSVNFKKQCLKYNIGIWQCPQFLFLIMGFLIAAAIVVTYLVARYYFDPYYVIILACGLAAALLIASFVVVSAFEMVAKSSMAKSDFIAAMSHRLRTSPTKIKWQLELLLSKKNACEAAEIESSLLEIQSRNEEIIRMANDLIDLNLIEDGKFVLSPSAFSLEKTIEESLMSLKNIAKETAISIFIDKPETALPDVFADKVKIKAVICHLVDNAMRYNKGGGKITLALGYAPAKAPGANGKKMAQCSVVDEGVGISDSETRSVFKKFFRSKEAPRYQTGGIGIGLYIAKTIVEKSGGSMDFQTMEGKGSVFRFTLPFA